MNIIITISALATIWSILTAVPIMYYTGSPIGFFATLISFGILTSCLMLKLANDSKE